MTLWERLKACDDGLPEPTEQLLDGYCEWLSVDYHVRCQQNGTVLRMGSSSKTGMPTVTDCWSYSLTWRMCARIRELLGLPPKTATAAPKDGR